MSHRYCTPLVRVGSFILDEDETSTSIDFSYSLDQGMPISRTFSVDDIDADRLNRLDNVNFSIN
jgi:hypothetical protein